MRKENIFITDREFCYALAGQLYEQSPNNSPRKAEVIMNKATEKFRSKCYHDTTFDSYVLTISKKDLYYFLKELLNSINEFIELNLSKNEYEAGILVDDESRAEFQFRDLYSKIAWENDFVDLDAFIGNLNCAILSNKDNNDDCFLCVNKETDLCKSCFVNDTFTNNYKCSRNPRGEYTFSCKYDCQKRRQICCEECEEKDTCEYKCNSNSDICTNTIHKENK